MKRIALTISALLFVAFTITFNFDVIGQRRPTNSNSRSSNVNKQQGTNTNRKSSNAIPTLTKEQILYNEAHDQLNAFWNRTLTKCGDSYFWQSVADDGKLNSVLEGKGNYTIYLESGQYYPLKTLTKAEQLNNEDPQPMEYFAVGYIHFDVGRTLPRGECGGCRWYDNFKIKAQFRKVKGKCETRPHFMIASTYKPVDCGKIDSSLGGQWFGLNLDMYCKKLYGESAHKIHQFRGDGRDAFGLQCHVPNSRGAGGTFYGMNIDEACRLQYGDSYKAKLEDEKDWRTWHCVPQTKRRNPTVIVN
jgi:hypothetical protein